MIAAPGGVFSLQNTNYSIVKLFKPGITEVSAQVKMVPTGARGRVPYELESALEGVVLYNTALLFASGTNRITFALYLDIYTRRSDLVIDLSDAIMKKVPKNGVVYSYDKDSDEQITASFIKQAGPQTQQFRTDQALAQVAVVVLLETHT